MDVLQTGAISVQRFFYRGIVVTQVFYAHGVGVIEDVLGVVLQCIITFH